MTVGTDPETDQILVDMLTENTGIAMCDSGGDNGRGWQRRRAAGLTTVEAWKAKPAAWIEAYVRDGKKHTDKWHGMLSTFHFLSTLVDYNERLDDLLQWYLGRNPDDGTVEFGTWLGKQRGMKVTGWQGDRLSRGYTYNSDNSLDVDVQYMPLEIEGRDFLGDEYIILQTHNGADARGGLSTPRAFSFSSRHGAFSSFLDFDRYSVSCNEKNGPWHAWTSEGCGSWLWDGSTSDKRCKLLKRPLKALNVREYGQCDVACPICGHQLHAWPYNS